MSDTSRVMVFTGPNEPLHMREYPLPRLRDGEILVEVTCCTLCGSDLHTFEGRRSVPSPTVLGHEILGRVVALPMEGVACDYTGRALEIGDRVTWSIMASCGTCFFCQWGLPQKCERLFKYGHERVDARHPLSGGLSEYCHLAAGTAIFQVPDDLADAVACPVNCATATVAAALRAGGDCSDQVVLVQGAGMLGLTAGAMARRRGAREVIVCDVNAQRLPLARSFGATYTAKVATEAEELREIVRSTTDGRGVDLVLEMCGAPSAMELGLELLRIGGRYVLAGSVFPSRPVALHAEKVVRNLLNIQGIHNYTPQDLAAALEFLTESQSEYPFAELVGAQFALMEANAAFRHAIDSGAFRVAVLPA